MNPVCQQAVADVGNGIAASLRGIDCVTMGATQAAFGRLFGSGGALLPALTVLLTLYVGFFALQLLTGRSRLGLGALTPRMMTLGLVLTFATSWIAYSQVVWNLALGAPNEIATVLTGVKGSATDVFAQKIDILFSVVSDAASGGQQGQEAAGASLASPQGLLWLGGMLLLLGTVGLLVTCRIALAVLIALGPIFVVLALFGGTRGLFVGWLKGVVLLSLAPLFAVLGGSLMLELAVPVVNALTAVPGELDPRAAMAFFMIGAVHVALMILVMKVATAMVAGWTVFGLARSDSETRGADTRPAAPVQARAASASPASAQAPAQRLLVAGPAAGVAAANDSGGDLSAARRSTRIYAVGGERATGTFGGSAGISRARGIGSRFRAAPARSMEKFK